MTTIGVTQNGNQYNKTNALTKLGVAAAGVMLAAKPLSLKADAYMAAHKGQTFKQISGSIKESLIKKFNDLKGLKFADVKQAVATKFASLGESLKKLPESFTKDNFKKAGKIALPVMVAVAAGFVLNKLVNNNRAAKADKQV